MHTVWPENICILALHAATYILIVAGRLALSNLKDIVDHLQRSPPHTTSPMSDPNVQRHVIAKMTLPRV